MIELKTVDRLLIEVNPHLQIPKIEISVKDKRILMSLAKQLIQGSFLTENQANLLLKIFKENLDFVKSVNPLAESVIENAAWSGEFRVIEKIRKILLDKSDDTKIYIQFTYDKRLKNKLTTLSKKIDGSLTAIGPKEYHIPFTEKNIFLVVTEFIKDNFDVEQKIMDFYHEIKEILKTGKDSFNVFSLKDEKLKNIVQSNVGEISMDNLLALHDKKIRYNYQVSEKIPEKSLVTAIAQRDQTKIYINNSQVSVVEVMEALKKLNRFPVLLIFDGRDPKIDKKLLENLENLVATQTIDNKIGIYFRYDKETDSTGFNATIAASNFNHQLDNTINVAGISNNKIPKFMIKSRWKPESIISFTNSFRNNKSSYYFSDVDLIIFYGPKQPIHGNVNGIM